MPTHLYFQKTQVSNNVATQEASGLKRAVLEPEPTKTHAEPTSAAGETLVIASLEAVQKRCPVVGAHTTMQNLKKGYSFSAWRIVIFSRIAPATGGLVQ